MIDFAQVDNKPYFLFPMYSLSSRAGGHPRSGALLKVTFHDRTIGYADCFPWPELGDEPLELQLKLLSQGKLTQLTQRSIEFAWIDAKARHKNHWLFQDQLIPMSNLLVTSVKELSPEFLKVALERGFQQIKLKLGANLEFEIQTLRDLLSHSGSLQFRFDFNSSVSESEFIYFLNEFNEFQHKQFDYIEDPFPYDDERWTDIQKKWKIRLAADRVDVQALKPGSFSVLILKPAVQNWQEIERFAKELDSSLVVTSYLDHPLGQFCAGWVALQIQKRQVVRLENCGLLTHRNYQPNHFSEKLGDYPRLVPIAGTGFGMDQLLELEWKRKST